jgi:hypothetical protein
MKKGGPSHPKTLALAVALGVHRLHAIGLLEQMFHWAYEYCPAGDIGKWPDEVISTGIGWDGKPTELVETMVRVGWLDRCRNNRLVIHDWSTHAPNWLKGILSHNNLDFASLDLISSDSLSEAPSVVDSGGPSVGRDRKGKVGIGKEQVDDAVDRWNTFAGNNGLGTVRRMSSQRISKVRKRLGTKGFDIQELLGIIPQCPFLMGDTGEWKIDFDWLFKNDDNWTKVIEGKYLPKGQSPAGTNGQAPSWRSTNTMDFDELVEDIVSMAGEPHPVIKSQVAGRIQALGADPDTEFDSLMAYVETHHGSS